MPRNTSSSGATTPVLSRQTTNDDHRRPQLRKNGPSGNNVTFAGEEDSQQDIITPTSMSFNNMRTSSFSSPRVKLRPLRSKKSLDTPSLDLSKSMAENELFTQVHRLDHTRSSSGHSTITSGSVTHRGAQYRHQPYTPVMSSRSRADSGEDLTSPYAPFAKTPPPLHIRTHSSSSNPRIKSSSQTHLEYPTSASSLRGEVVSAESMGRSGRSSFESAFRRRGRSNADSDPVAAAAIVREEWHARQAAKQRKREEEEARLKERQERRQEKVNMSRSRANTTTTMASSEKGSTLSAIRYDNTKPGLPVDKELEFIRAGIRPPITSHTSTSTTIKKKAKGTKNGFEMFFYNLYTVWLKFLHLVGVKRS